MFVDGLFHGRDLVWVLGTRLALSGCMKWSACIASGSVISERNACHVGE